MDISKMKHLPVDYTINNIFEASDSRFLDITIDVLHLGLNENGCIFDKEVVDANAESIKNVPVLGFIALNANGEEDFTKHEYNEILTADGIDYVYAGNAYGVVPESCNYRWVKKVCSDGETRTYFRVDAILWTKFEDAVSIFQESGGKPQSMELELSSIEGEEQEDGIFRFTNFKFEGCCLLSSTDSSIEPAMIDSVAVPKFSVENFAKDIKKRLREYSSIKTNKKNEGGKDMAKKDFTLSVMQKLDEIRAVLGEEKFVDEWGYNDCQYYLVDVQENEIIVYDRADHYRTYGIPYTLEGDKIVLDYDNKKRMKAQYVDFEDTDENPVFEFKKAVSDVASYMGEQITSITNEKNEVVSDFTTLKDEYDEMKSKYEQYVADEAARQQEAIETAKTAEFTKFDAHLSENEKYSELKANRDQYTLDEIKQHCATLFTEQNLSRNFTKNNKVNEPMTAGIATEESGCIINPRYGAMDRK